jgi:hypothetical protein
MPFEREITRDRVFLARFPERRERFPSRDGDEKAYKISGGRYNRHTFDRWMCIFGNGVFLRRT